MKVLLALDGSAPSLVARDLVRSLPWPAATVVHLLAAYQVPIDWTGGVGSTMDWVGDVEDAIRDQFHDELRTHAAPLVDGGLKVERHVIRGRAADAINDLAAQIGAELIVTGSRGARPAGLDAPRIGCDRGRDTCGMPRSGGARNYGVAPPGGDRRLRYCGRHPRAAW